jgi:hypothetical protein
VVGARLVDGAQHDLAVQCLDGHPAVDEGLRQVVEQLGMRRALAGDAEVARRIDESGPEMSLPDAIDDHPHRDRLAQDRVGELEPPAALHERRRVAFGQDREKMARLLGAEVVRAAAPADLEVDRLLDVADAVDEGVLRRLRLAERFDVGAEGVDVAPAVGAQLPLEAPLPEDQQAGLEVVVGLCGIEPFLEIALEDVGPQTVAIDRQALQLQPAIRAEIVVGDEVARQLGRLLLLRAGQRFRDDDVVLVLELLLLEHHVEQQRLEFFGERLRLGGAPAALDHRLPFRQVGIEPRRLREELDPALEELVIELRGVDDFRNLFLRLAGHLPRRDHVGRRLQRQGLRQLRRFNPRELLEQLFLLLDLLVLLRVFLDDALRRERVLAVGRVQEHAGQRVVVLRRNRVVLVIVAARAADREAEEAARDDVDAVVPLVGARDLDRAVVVEPRPEAEEAQRRQRARARRFVSQ